MASHDLNGSAVNLAKAFQNVIVEALHRYARIIALKQTTRTRKISCRPAEPATEKKMLEIQSDMVELKRIVIKTELIYTKHPLRNGTNTFGSLSLCQVLITFRTPLWNQFPLHQLDCSLVFRHLPSHTRPSAS